MGQWSKQELNFLEISYGMVPASDVATKLGRSEDAVIKMASRIGVKGFRRRVINYLPSRELAYIIGAVKGDGYTYINKHKSGNGYCIGLKAIDFEFVSEFRDNVGRLLGKFPKIHRVKNYGFQSKLGWIFVVQFCNKSLFMILKKLLEELKSYIEVYPVDFLRGFYDAEGYALARCEVGRRSPRFVVGYCNTDVGLLDFVRKLLIRLGIYPAPRTYGSKPRNGGKTPCYNLVTYRKDSVRRFMSLVGSSIPRKRLML